MSDYPSESWLDAQLRETPLPEGFLQRLRAVAREGAAGNGASRRLADDALDRLLREVALPEGLAARIRAAIREEVLDEAIGAVAVPEGLLANVRAAVAEERLDELLRETPIPAGLTAGIRAAIAEEAENEPLDEAVRRVEVPPSVAARARVIPRLRVRRHPLLRAAAAAALFVAVGASYFAGVAAVTSVGRPVAKPAPRKMYIDRGPLELETAPVEETAVRFAFDDGLSHPQAKQDGLDISLANIDHSPTRGPAGELAREFEQGFRPWQNAILARWQPLGAQWADDDLPSLDTVPAPVGSASEPPLVRGFDRVFLYKHGVNPAVRPDAHPQLAASSTRLSTSTASYDLTERLVAEGRLPDPYDVRVEDFLAAMDYPFPLPAPDQVRIRAAAGPSVFGNSYEGLRPHLLQVAAQAGPAGSRLSRAAHVTVAVDISASMDWGGRIEMTQRALSKLLDHFGPRDRLALVAFNEEVTHLVEDASREDRRELLDAIARLTPRGGTNLDAGLRQAVALSITAGVAPDAARRVVLLTDGRAGLPPSEVERIETLLAEAAGHGLRLDVIDLSRQETFPEDIERLAAAGGGAVRRGESADQIRWGLVESLLGRSSVIASDATLNVKFNPEAVAAYRLLGHEPVLMGTGGEAARGELRNLQAATTLFEVWLKPGEVDDVAVAELTWIDPHTGQSRREEQRISRLQFAPSLAESPLSLQAATVAAQTAEVLRESPFTAPAARDFGNILNVAGEVNPHLAQQESFRRFVALVRRLQDVTAGG